MIKRQKEKQFTRLNDEIGHGDRNVQKVFTEIKRFFKPTC